eukprot:g2282.t1
MSVDGPVVCTNNDFASFQDRFGRFSLSNNPGNFLTRPLSVVNSSKTIKDINVLLSVKDANEEEEQRGSGGGERGGEGGGGQQTTKRRIQFFADERIQNLVLQIQKREFSFMKQCLVFGDRKLLDQEDLKSCPVSDRQYIHILTKLSDIKKLEVTTDKRKSVLTGFNPVNSLTSTAAAGAGGADAGIRQPLASMGNQENRLVLRGSVIDQGKNHLLASVMKHSSDAGGGDPIVHLVIRKPTKVHCYHLKDEGFEIKVSAGATVEEVKHKIEELTDGFQAHEHDVLKEGHTLHPGMSLSELGVKKGDVLELVKVPLYLEEYHDPDSPFCCGSPKTDMPFEWEKAKDALAQGVRPKLSSAGTGGSYFISALEGKNLAVFKPQDEEPLAPNNPKGHRGSFDSDGLRTGVRSGEGAVREVIAFMLDHEHFSGVPPTTMVSLSEMHGTKSHRKVGSFQQFVQHDMDCEEMGPSKFPVHEVHKICVLDIRLANTDRNGGNILARQENGQWHLTPIDHGYCLPDSFKDINFDWVYWPQAKIPFNETTCQYISRLDAKKDLEILAKNGLCLRAECARVFLVCTMLLKKAITHGLTPQQIGKIMSRQTFTMSPLEKLHKQAKHFALSKVYGKSYYSGKEKYLQVEDSVYLETMESLLDQYLEEIQSV